MLFSITFLTAHSLTINTVSTLNFNNFWTSSRKKRNFMYYCEESILFERTNIHSKWPPSFSIQSCKHWGYLATDLQIISKGASTLYFTAECNMTWLYHMEKVDRYSAYAAKLITSTLKKNFLPTIFQFMKTVERETCTHYMPHQKLCPHYSWWQISMR